MNPLQVLVVTCGSWYLRETARAYQERGALAGLWISDKNSTGVDRALYRRCWPFHLAMKPFYHLCPGASWERYFWRTCYPLWQGWVRRQRYPDCAVVHASQAFATEPFDWAERHGALKVFDAANSYGVSSYALYRREWLRWNPGRPFPGYEEVQLRSAYDAQRADLVLCPSPFVRDSMVQAGIPAARCIIEPFGVDLRVFQPRRSPPARPRFICTGNLSLRKGHPYLFEAFARVRAACPETELVCVGDIKSELAPVLAQWQGTFIHHARLSHPELAALLQTATAFVLPSVEEGFARAILEALASGLPVIATHESGATGRVRDGVEGFIVPRCDPAALADAMLRLATDPALSRSMGEAATQCGRTDGSWQDYGDRLLAHFARLRGEA